MLFCVLLMLLCVPLMLLCVLLMLLCILLVLLCVFSTVMCSFSAVLCPKNAVTRPFNSVVSFKCCYVSFSSRYSSSFLMYRKVLFSPVYLPSRFAEVTCLLKPRDVRHITLVSCVRCAVLCVMRRGYLHISGLNNLSFL